MARERVAPREWRRVALYALALVILTSIPYLAGWLTAPAGWHFSGFVIGVDDGNSYIGKMRLGARGLWAFHLFYSPEPPQSAPLIFLPYIIPGQLIGLVSAADGAELHGILIVAFHILRVVFGFVMVLVIYRFIAAFVRGAETRFFALVLATLGGGLGWLLLGQDDFLGSAPPEFFIPEGFTFLILLTLPHLALARAALLGGLLALFEANARAAWLRWSLLAGGLWLVVGLAVPFYLVILYVVLGVWGLALWLRMRAFPTAFVVRGAAAAMITLPLFMYYTVVFTTNDAFAQWSAQNLLPSPHPLHYVLAYGALVLLAVGGGRWAWRRASVNEPRYALLAGWVLVVPLLVYLPLNVQRRMAESVLVPLAILAAAGARLFVAFWARRRVSGHIRLWRRMRAGVLLVAVPSSLLILVGSVLTVLNARTPVFRPAGEIAAFEWLAAHVTPGEVVLSAMPTGNALPAWTNLRVYVGHGPETLFSERREREVARFFSGEMSAGERERVYESPGTDYVFYGPAERRLVGKGAQQGDWMDELILIYEAGEYRIYRVRR